MTMGVRSADLATLQLEQFRHDCVAHKDILKLPFQGRLKHFTLHFAKYQGWLLRTLQFGNVETTQRLITDSFIILLAAANTLDKKLQADRESWSGSATTIDCRQLILTYIETVADMAKACEAFDNSEEFPSQIVLEDSIDHLVRVILDLAAVKSVDLLTSVPKRWDQVERRLSVNRNGAIDRAQSTAVA
jgi:hypothetical protein